MFDRVTQLDTIRVRPLDPVRTDSRWLEVTGHPAPIVQRGDGIIPEARSLRYVSAGWVPQRTGDWHNYVVNADVGSLGSENSAALVVRWGGAAAIDVRISANRVSVTRAGSNAVQALWKLQPGATHHVQITVVEGSTTVVADGGFVTTVRTPTGASAYGGFGITAFRQTVSDDFPVFSTMRITPVSR